MRLTLINSEHPVLAGLIVNYQFVGKSTKQLPPGLKNPGL